MNKIFHFPLTSERHGGSRLSVHLNIARLADFADVVAHRVAAALAATETHAAVKHVVAAASVGLGCLLLVQQRVNEQVDRALMFALHCVGDGWGGKRGQILMKHVCINVIALVIALWIYLLYLSTYSARLILCLTFPRPCLGPSVYFQSAVNGVIVPLTVTRLLRQIDDSSK